MSIQELTKHPELLNRETLYELRRMVAEYPYYQPARLLMLKNLYLLHDPAFDEELRRSAIYLTDRRVIFDLVEAAHYRLKKREAERTIENVNVNENVNEKDKSRTTSLINDFLSSTPKEEETGEKKEEKQQARKPTAADATVDYIQYLITTDYEGLNESPKLHGGDLIDKFIAEDGKITLQDDPEFKPDIEPETEEDEMPKDEYLTETLAGIYIKQGRYEKALKVMERINLTSKKKNIYYEDQQRFLKKVIMAKTKTN